MKPSVLRVALSALFLCAVTGAPNAEPHRRPSGTSAASVPQAVASGACGDLTKFNYKSDNEFYKSTYSSSYVNIADTNVSFTQGGTGNGCVIVAFTAESYARGARLLEIRARLDNAAIAAPGGVLFSGDDDEDNDDQWDRAHAFTFVFPSVAPGTHTVRMQFRNSGYISGYVYIGKHTIIVQHR